MLGILVGAVMALLALVNRSMDADLIANVFRGGHHAEKLPLGEYDAIQEEGDLIIIKLEGELNYLTTEAHITAMRTITKANQIVL
jgi:MFS superfamily sulfate permease-like transporter